jgi:hypothetical protein
MTTSRKELLLADLHRALRGPRRARRRLLSEIDEHLTDAIGAELDHGCEPTAAESRILDRFGNPAAVAAAWNAHQDARRGAMRRKAVVIAIAAAAAGALGVTQYASGKSSPPPRNSCPEALVDTRCTVVEPRPR